VDPFAVFERAGEAGSIAPASAERIAGGLGAGRYVLGQVVAAGEVLRIQAFLYDPSRGSEPLARVSVEGPVDRIFNLVDEIASQLLVAERSGPGETITQVAAVTTGSIDAFKWFLEGEQRFRQGRFSDAVEALERAVAIDSTFALAWYRLSDASGWMDDFEREVYAAERANRFAERLPPVERRIVRAHLLWPRGEVDEAERLFLEVLAVRPESADAWYGLGELYFHQNPMRGRSWSEARRAFERSIELSGRERYEALIHLADLAGIEGRRDDYEELYARMTAVGDFTPVYAAQKAFSTGGPEDRERALAMLEEAGPGATLHAARRTAAFGRNPAGALRMVRLLTGDGMDARTRAAGHLTAAVLETALGRWPAARRELEGAEALAGPTARLWRAVLAAHPTLRVPRADLEAARASLEAWDPARPPATPPALSLDEDLHGPLRVYAMGLLSARLGDGAAVRRHAAALARTSSPETQELPRDLGRDLTARALAAEGRWDEALAELEAIRGPRDYDRTVRSPFFQQIHTRWLRAEALERLGRPEEALRWYRSVPQHHFDAVIFQAPAARREEAILAAGGGGG
jgi:tetratricopeptide (TPR) repeat protein